MVEDMEVQNTNHHHHHHGNAGKGRLTGFRGQLVSDNVCQKILITQENGC